MNDPATSSDQSGVATRIPSTALEFTGVHLTLDGRPLFSGLDLRLSSHEFVILAGRSGSGKTTLLKLAAGLMTPDRGRILSPAWCDDGGNRRTAGPRVGFVRQQPESQLIAGTVEEEVAFALTLANLPDEEIRRRVDEALEATKLQALRDRPPHTLSAGMMQRLAIAAALALQPELWLFDEPTAYLDPPSAERVRELARKTVEKRGTVLFVSSNPAEFRPGDRLLLLHEGRIIADGRAEQVLVSDEYAHAGMNRPRSTPALRYRMADKTDEISGSGRPNLPETQEDSGQTVPFSSSAGEILLRLRGIRVGRRELFGAEREVLHGLDLEIRAGETVAVIGPAGAGKTTLLEVSAGLTPCGTGEIDRAAVDRGNEAGYAGIGIAFQFPERQFFAETVLEEVSYGPRNRGLKGRDGELRALESLRRVGLGMEYSGRSPFELSGGEARRVALAIALALRPRLLLLDEPTAGLDREDAELVGELIVAERAGGRAVVVSGHDLERFARWCPRWVLMKDGAIVYDGLSTGIDEEYLKSFWG